eukprot:gene1798-940_t
MSKFGRLVKDNVAFFACDIQKNFMKIMPQAESVIFVGKQLTKASRILNTPIFITEQYPKYFGNTEPEITDELQNPKIYHKMKFSMLTEELEKDLITSGRKQIVLFGIEAHVCILQTSLELMEKGYEVHLAADGVASQRQFDRSVAFDRLKQSGAFISTYESILFQIVRDAKNENFKEISKLCNSKFTGERPDPGQYII